MCIFMHIKFQPPRISGHPNILPHHLPSLLRPIPAPPPALTHIDPPTHCLTHAEPNNLPNCLTLRPNNCHNICFTRQTPITCPNHLPSLADPNNAAPTICLHSPDPVTCPHTCPQLDPRNLPQPPAHTRQTPITCPTICSHTQTPVTCPTISSHLSAPITCPTPALTRQTPNNLPHHLLSHLRPQPPITCPTTCRHSTDPNNLPHHLPHSPDAITLPDHLLHIAKTPDNRCATHLLSLTANNLAHAHSAAFNSSGSPNNLPQLHLPLHSIRPQFNNPRNHLPTNNLPQPSVPHSSDPQSPAPPLPSLAQSRRNKPCGQPSVSLARPPITCPTIFRSLVQTANNLARSTICLIVRPAIYHCPNNLPSLARTPISPPKRILPSTSPDPNNLPNHLPVHSHQTPITCPINLAFTHADPPNNPLPRTNCPHSSDPLTAPPPCLSLRQTPITCPPPHLPQLVQSTTNNLPPTSLPSLLQTPNTAPTTCPHSSDAQ
nr:proline-rich protein 36-like [Penaeus vannamei]